MTLPGCTTINALRQFRQLRARAIRRFLNDYVTLSKGFGDSIAITLLRRLYIEASQLMGGIEKISRFNRERLGPAINESDYPTVARRRDFARAVTTWVSLGLARTPACR